MKHWQNRLSHPFDPSGGLHLLDTVIVGSGYGGSVMAARLAEALPTSSVVVLERGKELQPGQYPESFADALPHLRSPQKPLGMFDFRFGQDMDVVVANAVGGGSIINAAVMMEPKGEVFDDGCWPQEINSLSMKPYLAFSSTQLSAKPTPSKSDSTALLAKLEDLRLCAKDWQLDKCFSPLSIAINHERFENDLNAQGVRQLQCNHCGNCVTGCNRGSKNSLLTNYLPVAVEHSARIYSGVEVFSIELSEKPGYRYKLVAIVHSLVSGARDTQRTEIHCRRLCLAAGSLGSTELLLRAQQQGSLNLSSKIGHSFSGNGDSLALVSGAPTSGLARDDRMPGPCINGMLDFRERPLNGSVIQDGTIPAALTDLVIGYLKSRGFSRSHGHTQILLAMGYDSSIGQLYLNEKLKVEVYWPEAAEQNVLRTQAGIFRQIARHWGGEALANPRAAISLLGWRGGTPITAHPLGGCRMGDCAEKGVTDSCGRVWNAATGEVYPGLYVMDGSVLPRSLGANPSLTITAIAERAANCIVSSDLPARTDAADSAIVSLEPQ